MSIINCQDLSIGYDKKPIIENLNFCINKGDYLCIVGENGSGKSTLMKTILGLIHPISGKITFGDGVNYSQIGYLPQQTVVQKDFPATVFEIVLSGFGGKCGLSPFYKKEYKEIAEKNIEKMGISHLKKACYRELSGGQQQRVLLARALCASTSVILLDEPVSGLDPTVTKEMYSIIEELNNDGVTVIMISHDIESALRYSSHILNIGKSLFFAATEQYKEYLRNKSSEVNGDVI